MNIEHIFGGPFTVEQKRVDDPATQLINAIASAGIDPPEHIEFDTNRIVRYGRKKNSWYIAYSDGVPAGQFGDWRLGLQSNWRADVGRELSAAEEMALARRWAESKKAREAEEAKRHEVTSDTVDTIWSNGAHADASHPYLVKKGVQPHGVRITGDGRLMVPLFSDGELASLQYITADGDKRFHTGGKVAGCCYSVGEPTATVYVAEGFATAATVHEVTQCQCVVAFNASNIPAVVSALRSIAKSIVVVADNDEHGVGKRYADQSGARVVMPPIMGMDANDYHQAGYDLMALLSPPTDNWLVPASEYIQQPAPIAWLIKGWIQREALHMVHGPSGGGKTFITVDMAMHIASQSQYGTHSTHGGPVVYLAGEGHHGLRSRMAAWKEAHPGADMSQFYISKSGCDLNTPEGYTRVVEAVRGLPEPPALIIVDTLHRFMSGDENSAQDTKTMLDACSSLIIEFSAAVILVHHTGVSEEAQHRARGSSAWRGALDIEISVVPAKGDDPIEVIQRKQKDGELAPNKCFKLEPVEIPGWFDEDGEQVTSVVPVETEAVKKVTKQNHKNAMKVFEKMWNDGGRELYCDAPYVSNSFAKEAFIQMGHTAGTAKKYSLGTSEKGPFAQLATSQMLRKVTAGWIIEDSAWCILTKESTV